MVIMLTASISQALLKHLLVNEELGKNSLIVDLRSPELFSKGHIKGAVNINFSKLPEYFETGIKPFEFDKIILVCEDGQVSSYTTALLRMMGYGNVFAMRWGMCGWNKSYAEEGWLKGASGKYEDRLEVTTNETPEPVECLSLIPASQRERRSEMKDSKSSLLPARVIS